MFNYILNIYPISSSQIIYFTCLLFSEIIDFAVQKTLNLLQLFQSAFFFFFLSVCILRVI